MTKVLIGTRIPKSTANSVLYIDSDLKLAEDNTNLNFNDLSNLFHISNIEIPTTTSVLGIIQQNGIRLIHSFGTNNFFAGQTSGNFTLTGNNNVGIGSNALNVLTSGNNNMGIGANALLANTEGSSNVAIGTDALKSNIIAGSNVAIGTNALEANVTGGNCIAIGTSALIVSDNDNNIGIGAFALNDNESGQRNIGIGSSALALVISGNSNVGIGNGVLDLTTGSNNTAIGLNAGNTNTTGNNNLLLGDNSDVSTTNLSNAIAIGSGAIVNASDNCVIGGTGQDEIDGQITGNWKIGSGAESTNYTLTFDGEINNGVITYIENEDVFDFNGVLNAEGFVQSITTITIPTYTIVRMDYTLLIDTSSNNVTLTLPDSGIDTGQIFYIKLINSANVGKITSSATIDNDGSDITLTLYESITVQWDGSEYWVI